MKKYVYIVLTGILLFSCGEDFLEKEPTSKISAGQVFTNDETINAMRTGMYATLLARNGSEYPLYSFELPLLSEFRGNDMVYGGLWWDKLFLEPYRYTVNKESERLEGFFSVLFKVAEVVNTIDANITDEMAKKNSSQAQLKAEAKAVRAMVNVDMARFFGKAYHLDKGASKSIPYLNTLQYDPTQPGIINKPFRNTMKEIYEFAIKDLTDALPYLAEASEKTTVYMNKSAANAILARIYLDLHEYDKAKKHAEDAMQGITLMSAEEFYLGGLSRLNSESILCFVADPNHITHFQYHINAFFNSDMGSAWDFVVNISLFDLFKDSDIRKSFFTVEKGTNYEYWVDYTNPEKAKLGLEYSKRPQGYTACGKMPQKDSDIAKGIRGTFGLGDYNYIRGAEMVLTIAECAARLGDDATAQAKLYEIQKRADATAVQSTKTGTELLDEILVERRKELFGEGHSLRDILRLGKGLHRDGSQVDKLQLEANDSRFVWPLPRTATERNPNLLVE